MFTDMVGFSGLTQTDEAHALEVLDRHNRLLRPLFPRFHGTEVKAIGDSFLVEFESALEATSCAIAIQQALEEYNATAGEPWQVHVRIGVHLGDVVHSAGDVFGDAVNIAARIEPLAEAGGVCVSDPVFGQVRNKLDVTFDRIPSTDLKNLRFPIEVYKVVWNHGPGPSPGRPPWPSANHRLAVLPFSNLSPDPQDEFFSDGLTEELIAELARVPGCQVIARTSVMRFKGASKGIKEVGRELNVDVALEGSVRKSGNRIRITAQLIDAKSETHLWADRFDRELKEIFELQSEIASRVATALKVELVPRPQETLRRPSSASVEAYESYLKGRQFWWLSGEENYRAAILHFEKAIEKDPGFALAYCGLADSHALLGNHGYVPLEGALQKTEAAARKALELDPRLADAYVSLAPVLYNRYDWSGAVTQLRRAIELDPSNVLGHYWLAVALSVDGSLDEALQHAKIAAAIDPLSRQAALSPASFLYLKHDFAGAIAYMDEVERRIGVRSEIYQGLCELLLGRFDSALEHIRRTSTGPTGNAPGRRALLAVAYARAGKTDESRKILDQLVEDARANRAPAGVVARAFGALGENDRAFEWFDRAFEQKTVLGVEDLKSDPLLDGIRTDSRYPGTLRRFNFTP